MTIDIDEQGFGATQETVAKLKPDPLRLMLLMAGDALARNSAASDTADGGEEDGEEDDVGGKENSGTGAPAEDETRLSLDVPGGEQTDLSDGMKNPSPPEPGSAVRVAKMRSHYQSDNSYRFAMT
ncbi:MAG: hypothetical protein QGF68_20485 [Nitrospinota bacterium]|nr:hypothetical protein [Nitrospinota bacterium]